MIMCCINVRVITEIHVLMAIFGVMDDRNVQVVVMNVIVIVCVFIDQKIEIDREWFFLEHPATGLSYWMIILIALAILFLVCILSTGNRRSKRGRKEVNGDNGLFLVLICCCCRAAVNGILRRFRTKKTPSLFFFFLFSD